MSRKNAAPSQLACSLAHDSFLLPARPRPDPPSPEAALPQEWSSVEEDDESEDPQVSWGSLPLLMRPPLQFSVDCHSPFLSLKFPGPTKVCLGMSARQVSGGKQDVFCSSQTWSGGYRVVDVTPSMYTLQPFTHKCFMN